MDARRVELSMAAGDQVENTSDFTSPRPTEQTTFSLLGDLQPELLDIVIDFLESLPPSEVKRHHRPALTLTKSVTATPSKPFKNLSLAASWIRRIIFRRLFQHVCLDPNNLPNFLDFCSRNDLGQDIKSVTAVITRPCKLVLHPLWWARLLNEIPCQTFTIVCPPSVFAEFMAPSVVDQVERDSQAFKMPFHAMTFYQSELSAMQHTSLNEDHDIFSARNWTSLSINEGSFYHAYLHRDQFLPHEYFLRAPPSLISQYLLPCPTLTDLALLRLEHFTYIAIYPFFNHVDVVLKMIRKMTSLKYLTIRLCPHSEDPIGAHETASEPPAQTDLENPYTEIGTAYTLLAHTVRAMCVDGSLQVLRVRDYEDKDSLAPSADIISRIIGARMAYQRRGVAGVWQRVETG